MGRFHATKSKVQAINVNPTVAVKVIDGLSIGAGFNYQRLSADFNQVVAYGGISVAKAQSLGGRGRGRRDRGADCGGARGLAKSPRWPSPAPRTAMASTSGALYEINEQAKVAVSYRSKIKHDVSGDVTFDSVPTFQGPGARPARHGLNASFASGNVQTSIEMPDTLSVAGSWKKDKLEILADWTFTRWSSIDSLDIYREDADGNKAADPFSSVALKFQNTWRAGLGASWKFNDAFTFRVGGAYDKAPVQDEFRTPRLPDNNRLLGRDGRPVAAQREVPRRRRLRAPLREGCAEQPAEPGVGDRDAAGDARRHLQHERQHHRRAGRSRVLIEI